jgi:hypothetical protein
MLSATPLTDRDWRGSAACVGVDPRLFDPPEWYESAHAVRSRLRTAGAVCARCPVVAACLQDAVDCGDVGFRGGILLVRRNLSAARPAPRVVERRLRPCGTEAAWKRHCRYGEPVDAACAAARSAALKHRYTTRKAAVA